MKQKPWIVSLMTGALLLVPVTMFGLYLFRTRTQDMHIPLRIVVNLWIFGIVCVFAAIGIWRVRPWGYILFFIFILGILGGDFYEIFSAHAILNFWEVLNITLVTVGLGAILHKHVRAPYFNPRIRWWETSPRKKIDLPTVLIANGKNINCQLLDISSSGCFLSNGTDEALELGQIVSVQVTFNDLKFESPAEVMRYGEDPKGIGLMFVQCTFQNKKKIKAIFKSLKDISTFR